MEGHAVDLRIEEEVRGLFGRLGSFDHLVYTAGENLNLKLIAETDLAATRDFFTLRFWGALAAVMWATPHIRPGGSVSLMSGTASMRPGKGWSVASAICGAVEGFTRALAVELAPVRVNCVVPGVIRTELWSSMAEADCNAMYNSLASSVLLNRVGEAEDVAAGFLYLMQQLYSTG